MRDPARNEREALRRYKRVLQRSLGVVTQAVWVTGEREQARGTHFLRTSEVPLRLTSVGGGYVYLAANQSFTYEKHGRFVGEYKVKTLGYIYAVGLGPSREDTIVAWHWHPENRPDCHAHVYAPHDLLPEGLAELHIPTSRVSMEQVLRFLIQDLGVRARTGWEDAIADSEGRFLEYRSWG